MDEIASGLWHWTALQERIGIEVSSYYLERERVAIDVMLPAGGLAWFEQHGPPDHVLLSNRHHDRHSWRLHEEFGTTIHCIRNGLHELDGRGSVRPFEFGEELPGGIVAHEVNAICPDETALFVARHHALVCADGVIRMPGNEELQFVPDNLMDDPAETKRGLCDAYRRLLELDFDTLLLAHGEPIVGGAHEALRRFVEAS
jgi:hypothetical protein